MYVTNEFMSQRFKYFQDADEMQRLKNTEQ